MGYCLEFSIELTTRLNHDGEISGDSGFDSERQSHDGEGDGPTALGGCSGDHCAEHHRDGEQVPIYRIL